MIVVSRLSIAPCTADSQVHPSRIAIAITRVPADVRMAMMGMNENGPTEFDGAKDNAHFALASIIER